MPTTSRVEIVGDYAGRAMKVSVDGRVAFEGRGQLAPSGVSWFIGTGPGEGPAALLLEIEACERPFVSGVPRDAGTYTLIIKGCDFELVK